MAFQSCKAKTALDGGFSYKISLCYTGLGLFNLKRYQNSIHGSKVTEIFLNVCILPIGGVASSERSLQGRLV